MFDIGWGKLILIGIVALIVIGPKELPSALRTLGQWMAKIRRMASEFQGQFHEAMREAELADLKKEVDEMATKAKGYAQLDPVEDLRREVESAVGPPPELNAPLTSPPATESSPAPVSGDAPAADAPAIAAATASEPAVDPAPATVVEQAVANAPTPAEPVSSAPTSLAPGSDAPHSDAPHSDAPKSDAGRAA